MLQRKVIPLTGADRSGDGEEFVLAAGGGIFFDQVDGIGITVRFDGDRTEVPIRAGRAIDKKFSAFSLVHGPGYTGNVVAYLYEKGEGIFDSPTFLELAAVEGAVLGTATMAAITGGRFGFAQLANPAGSAVLLKVVALRTTGAASHSVRRFATDLPLETGGLGVEVGRKFEDLRLWTATPAGVLTCGQNPAGGDTPLTHEGGVRPLVRGTPAAGDRLIYRGEGGGGIILPPGAFLVVGPTGGGVLINELTVYWREFAQA